MILTGQFSGSGARDSGWNLRFDLSCEMALLLAQCQLHAWEDAHDQASVYIR